MAKTGTADCTAAPTSCDAIAYTYADLAGTAATRGATSRQTATMPGSNHKQIIEANGCAAAALSGPFTGGASYVVGLGCAAYGVYDAYR